MFFLQALKLWWKNVSYIQHPMYTNPAYREEASIRDHKIQCCPIIGSDKDKHLQFKGSNQGYFPDRSCEIHQFTWRKAKWPWSWIQGERICVVIYRYTVKSNKFERRNHRWLIIISKKPSHFTLNSCDDFNSCEWSSIINGSMENL